MTAIKQSWEGTKKNVKMREEKKSNFSKDNSWTKATTPRICHAPKRIQYDAVRAKKT